MIPFSEALAWICANTAPLGAEDVAMETACGRVLSAALGPAVPGPPAAVIDGFAVPAAQTEGASDYAPLPVSVAPVVAGSPLPAGMDAVLPPHLVEGGYALAPAVPGDGVRLDDPAALPSGTILRPAHLAIVAALASAGIAVVRRPRVALVVAGPKSGPDIVTPMMRALIEAEGGRVADTPDLCLGVGRSGPGPDDNGIRLFERIAFHGVLLRPGETVALGWARGVPALLLPGDPLAAATTFALLAAPAIRRLGGRPEPPARTATLARKISSGLGQTDAVRVRLRDHEATPIDAARLSIAAEADGLVLVPEWSEGYPAGTRVAISTLP